MGHKLEEIPFEPSTGAFLITILSGFLLFIAIICYASYDALKVKSNIQELVKPGFVIKVPETFAQNIANPEEWHQEVMKEIPPIIAMHPFSLADITPFAQISANKTTEQLIDIRLLPTSILNHDEIKATLQRLIPGVDIQDRGVFFQSALREQNLLALTAFFLIFIMITAVMVTVASITRSYFRVHERVITILRFLGAGNAYISRKFQEHFFYKTLKGGIWGSFCALCLVLFVGFILMDPSHFKNWMLDQFFALFGILCMTLLAANVTVRLTISMLVRSLP